MSEGSREGDQFVAFTASQRQELEHQTLAFKYIVSGIPLPPHLISTLMITTPFPSSSIFPLHQHTAIPIGWGCFEVGYGRKTDPEPGRCRRTDGKKWRCSKEASPNSKYCERHINRGKSKSKKQQQVQPLHPTTTTVPAVSSSVPPSSVNHHQYQDTSAYPFRSPRSSSQQSSQSAVSAQNQAAPLWLLDPKLYAHQPSKTIRFEF